MDLETFLSDCQGRVNQKLDIVLPTSDTEPCVLHEAMRYAVLNGGKRIRCAFIRAIGESLGAEKDVLDISCVAIELIHAFSLVHDDLPAIDNDDLRRGKLSCHKQFGEAIAILAGDALLVLSFEIMTQLENMNVMPNLIIRMIKILSYYVGSKGMAGGEALDIIMLQNSKITLFDLMDIYKLKTSYLLCASIILGALSANCNDPGVLNNLEKFGIYVGLAFQVHDDIIELESSSELIGKPHGSDLRNNKLTVPLLLGIKDAKNKQDEYLSLGLEYLAKTGIDSKVIVELSHFMINRIY